MMTLFWAEEGEDTKGHCILARLGSAEKLKEFISQVTDIAKQ